MNSTSERADRYVRALPVSTEAARLAAELADADAYADELEREIEQQDVRLAELARECARLRGECDRLAWLRDTLLAYLGAGALVVSRLRGQR